MPDDDIPQVAREFRAVWVATVSNIDWPSSRTLSTRRQKEELLVLLDRAKELNLNAFIFQVRPQADALYASALEPWSQYLTGQMGKAPNPLYDPLEFAVAEAHKRGLELHVWFNPYRALVNQHGGATIAPNHISRRRPDLCISYGPYLWLDPGEKDVQDYSLRVVLDVVARYDIDGVHFDDYFYPYPLTENGHQIAFKDDSSWNKYVANGGRLNRPDWRRLNVNEFIRRTTENIKSTKQHVKFGISPFGVWRYDNPPGTRQVLSAYDELYADTRLWLRDGWVDYLAPQLYWPINQSDHGYVKILDWWLSQNVLNRHVWPGNYVSKFSAAEMINQIVATRRRASTGNIFFSAEAFKNNRDGINDRLKSGPYSTPALVPPSPWLEEAPPQQPSLTARRTDVVEMAWKVQGDVPPFLWVLYTKHGGTWRHVVLPNSVVNYTVTESIVGEVSKVAISAVGRTGSESPRTVVSLG